MKKIIKFVVNRIPRPVIQRVAHRVMPFVGRLLYNGDTVECPICKQRYREFMPYGHVEVRSNALCPSCLALERHRLLWLYLNNETNFNNATRMLHIAPEYCFLKQFTAIMGDRYRTADLESPLAQVKTDVQDMPFDDKEFSLVICNHLLEHVEDDRKAIAEIYRVMRDGGWGIILSPVNYDRATTLEDPTIKDPEERKKIFGQHDHLREYGRDFALRLREAGFDVQEIDYYNQIPEIKVKKYGLRPEIIYRVDKIATQ